MNDQISGFVSRIEKHITDGVFPLAHRELEQGLRQFPESIELQLLRHRVAVRQKKYTVAADFLIDIQKKYPTHELYIDYLQNIGNSVLHQCQNEHLVFYRNAPRATQKQLLLSAAVSLERSGEYLSACKLHSNSLTQFPELIPSYGPRSIDIALKGEEKNKPLPAVNGFRSTIVNSIIPTIFKQKVIVKELTVNYNEIEENQEFLCISKEQFNLWLEIIQGYCLSNMEFLKLHELFLMMIKQCNIFRNKSDDTDLSTPDKFLSYVDSNPDSLPSEIITQFLVGYFIQMAVDYYLINSDQSNTNESSGSIVIPLIPIPISSSGSVAKRQRLDDSPAMNTAFSGDRLKSADQIDAEIHDFFKRITMVYKKGRYESESFEDDLESTVSRMKLPFVVENSVLFARADMAMFEGSASMAISLYRSLSTRLKEAWQTQRYIMNKVNSTQSTDHNLVLEMDKVDLSILKSRWSPIFPFRLIYSTGLCYLTESNYNEAVTEFFSIIGAMPFNSFDHTIDVRHRKPGLKKIYPEALAALCLEYIMDGVEQEIHQQGPRDTTISCLMVISQFLSTERNPKTEMIYEMILNRGRFEFPDFFRYIFDSDILHMISQLSTKMNLELNGKIGDQEIRPILSAHMNNISSMQNNWRQILVKYSRTYLRLLVNASGTAPSFI